ncbi:MAG: DoxX family protein [Acidimicrobiales bacterium]
MLAGGNVADLAMLLARLVLCVVFVAHGLNHIFGGGKIKGTARWFEGLGMSPGWLHAWTASVTELGSGILLGLGLITPIAAGGVVGVMAVAWATNHARNGFFIFRPGEGYEYVMVLAVLAVAVAALGAGGWSLDHALGLQADLAGWAGLGIAAGSGLAGAGALLGVFWRRPSH